MGISTPVILKIATPDYKKLIVDTSDGKRYHSDLSPLSNVYCFPKTAAEWEMVNADSDGFALIWSSRFEAHIDQIIAFATKIENQSA
jgi:hypothetical protein